MLPRARRRSKPILAGLGALLLRSSVQSQHLSTPSLVSCPQEGYGSGHARGSAFIPGGTWVGGGVLPVGAASKAFSWESAWTLLPRLSKNCPHSGPSSRAVGGQKHIVRSTRNAQRDHDIDTPTATTDSIGGVGLSVDSRPLVSGGPLESEHDNNAGWSVDSGTGVRSLVDLVKHLKASENPLWELVRFEGREASKQSHVSTMIHGSVLARTSLEDAVSFDVASKIATTFLSSTEVRCLMYDMYADEPLLDFVVAEDLLAHAMKDTSLPDVLTAMLFHKGFTALTTYRLMHWLWKNDRRNLARYLQSICSEVCAADIHPAATIGNGILMASGCDIVIGETAVVGDGVCLLQGVTLGGTGNQTGDRHPKVGNGCHIGTGSSILGNIPLGEGSRIEASSVVVKPVKPYTINRGVPSQTVGWIVCDPHQDVGAGPAKDVDETGGEVGVGDALKPRRLFSNYGSLFIGV